MQSALVLLQRWSFFYGSLKSLSVITVAFGWYWILLIYSSCAVLRLARYNVASIDKTNLRSGYFVGVPTPAASMLLLLPILLEINFIRLNVPFNKELSSHQ